MPISDDDLSRIDALLAAQFYSIKGSQQVTIIKQGPEGEESIIEDKLHPLALQVIRELLLLGTKRRERKKGKTSVCTDV